MTTAIQCSSLRGTAVTAVAALKVGSAQLWYRCSTRCGPARRSLHSRGLQHALPLASPQAQVVHRTLTSPQTIPHTDVILRAHPDTISIEAPSLGILQPFHFDHVWLRDACQSSGAPNDVPSVHASTKQKLFHTSDIDLVHDGDSLLDSSAMPTLDLSTDEPAVVLQFSSSHPVVNSFSALFSSHPPLSTRPHETRLPVSQLLAHASVHLYASSHYDVIGKAEPWDAESLNAKGGVMQIGWDSLAVGMDVESLTHNSLRQRLKLTEALLTDGLVIVDDVPTKSTGSNMTGEGTARLKNLAEMLGEIRNTFYGHLWDVRSIRDSRNIAYTNLDLGLHMDLLYFQSPPRFQLLHMLRNKVSGGESIFVDAFGIAVKMWKEEHELWDVLTRVPVGFHYVNDGHHYRHEHFTFELDSSASSSPPTSSGMPRLHAVNYSPPFQSPIPLTSPHAQTPSQRALFYRALARFRDLTHAPEFRMERKLKEGETALFDNRRVLHARRGFEWREEDEEAAATTTGQRQPDGGVKRWLKGCYIDGDAVWSSHRVLQARMDAQQPPAHR